MGISEKEITEANRRADEMKKAFSPAVSVRYDEQISKIVITLANGIELTFAPSKVRGLENAKPAGLLNAEISPSGLGIHFPYIDADVYIPSLLRSVGTPMQ